MVLGATTFRQFVQMLASSTEGSEVRDPWVTRMRSMPATLVSSTLEGPLDWPDATIVGGDDLPRHLRTDRDQPDLRGRGRLRPRAAREPDARRPHPRGRLTPHPSVTSSRCVLQMRRVVEAHEHQNAVRLYRDVPAAAEELQLLGDGR